GSSLREEGFQFGATSFGRIRVGEFLVVGFVSASPNGSSFDSPKLSLPFEPLRSRKTKKLVSNIKHWKNSSPKAVYSEGLSIRDETSRGFSHQREVPRQNPNDCREGLRKAMSPLSTRKMGQFVYIVRKRIKLSAEKAIFVFDKAIERCIVRNIVRQAAKQAAIRDVQEASVYEDTLCQSFTLRCNTVQSFKSKEYVCETFAWIHYY
ncbi:unnamed protein product, partial [Thlaspi arvense]